MLIVLADTVKGNIMEEVLKNLKEQFPTIPRDVLRNIYRERTDRWVVLRNTCLPKEICQIVEAKVRQEGELPKPLPKMPGMGRSSYSKKRRAKRMNVCYKCARWNCDKQCRNPGMVSINREDKIRCIKDGLRKEPLDSFHQALEAHPSGYVHRVLIDLFGLFQDQKERYNIGDQKLKDHARQFLEKMDKP